MNEIESFIRGLPKTDLHIHLEGSIEPSLMLELAARNGIKLRWNTPEALRNAYTFQNLQSFLDLYFEGCKVIVTEEDFFDVTRAYLCKACKDGVIRAEIFIGPQSFTERGIPIEALMSGVLAAMAEAHRKHSISTGLLISVHRHRTEEEAMAVLDQIMPWQDHIIGIGMGGTEVGNPPSKFIRFFQAAHDRGFKTTVHAGEEGPASYIWEALQLLHVDRIDHGNSCIHDPNLLRELAIRQIPLTICPLSNVRLNVVSSIEKHPLKELMNSGLYLTINSDDPPYFGGYVTENLISCQKAFDLSLCDIVKFARNGIDAAFVTDEEYYYLMKQLDIYLQQHVVILDKY